MILEILQAMSVILEFDEKCGLKNEQSFAFKFEMDGGLDELEKLQKHPNITVYNAVDAMVTRYFDEDAENSEP